MDLEGKWQPDDTAKGEGEFCQFLEPLLQRWQKVGKKLCILRQTKLQQWRRLRVTPLPVLCGRHFQLSLEVRVSKPIGCIRNIPACAGPPPPKQRRKTKALERCRTWARNRILANTKKIRYKDTAHTISYILDGLRSYYRCQLSLKLIENVIRLG
jgi:hypothetical protein